MHAALVIMAAGIGSRYGGSKQTDGVGPHGEILMEYGVYDAVRAGFDKVVFIIKPDMRERTGGLWRSVTPIRTTRHCRRGIQSRRGGQSPSARPTRCCVPAISYASPSASSTPTISTARTLTAPYMRSCSACRRRVLQPWWAIC